MLEYTIGSTEFVPLLDMLTLQEEAQAILDFSIHTPVKFVLVETRVKVLRLLIFKGSGGVKHANAAQKNIEEQGGEFFGAGNIVILQSLTSRAVWDSESCKECYRRDRPDIESSESDEILIAVGKKALECLTTLSLEETSS